jgi:hypothetical protein
MTMRISPIKLFILNLGQRVSSELMGYMSVEAAYQSLRQSTDVDFGNDFDAWRDWYNTVGPEGKNQKIGKADRE